MVWNFALLFVFAVQNPFLWDFVLEEFLVSSTCDVYIRSAYVSFLIRKSTFYIERRLNTESNA